MSSEDKQNLYDPRNSTDDRQQQLYDPYIPPSDSKAAYPAPQYQPQASSYQPVQVVNTAPTRSTFTMDETMPPNYLVLNIFTLLCCCWLFGLIGLFYALQVEKHWLRGNHYQAKNASRTAKRLGIAGIITGIFIIAAWAIGGVARAVTYSTS